MNTGRRLALVPKESARRRSVRLAVLKRVLRMAVSHIEGHDTTVSTRKMLDRLAGLAPPPISARRRDVTVGGVRCRWFVPHGKPVDDTVVVHFHGGGFSMCSVRNTHDFFLADYAALTGRRVLGVDYRKAPEYPFPVPIEDCLAVYRALLTDGIEAQRVVFSGDSAGGNLCLAVGQRLRSEGIAMPRSMVLMSPWVDLELKGLTIGKHESTDYITRGVLKNFVRSYMGEQDPSQPLASPVHAEFQGFPPLFVQVGANEAMLSEVRYMVCKAQSHGVRAHIEEWPDMVHAFQGFSVLLPDAKRALKSVGRYLDGVHREASAGMALVTQVASTNAAE